MNDKKLKEWVEKLSQQQFDINALAIELLCIISISEQMQIHPSSETELTFSSPGQVEKKFKILNAVGRLRMVLARIAAIYVKTSGDEKPDILYGFSGELNAKNFDPNIKKMFLKIQNNNRNGYSLESKLVAV
jgi:hypothetical protein